MNKLIPVVLVVLLLLVGGGIYLATQTKKETPKENNTNVKNQQEGKEDVFTSIKDALSKSLSLECTYKDEDGIETKTYVKAGAVRVDATKAGGGDEAYSQVIFKDNKMYSWNPMTKKGIMFELKPVEVSPSAQKETGDDKGESFLADLEKYKDSCKPAVVADSLFTPPSDVSFEDFSKMMESVKTNIPQNGVPSGFDIEELKKQFPQEDQ